MQEVKNDPKPNDHNASLENASKRLPHLSEVGKQKARENNWVRQTKCYETPPRYDCKCKHFHPVSKEGVINYRYGYDAEGLQFEELSLNAGGRPIFQKDLHPHEFGKY